MHSILFQIGPFIIYSFQIGPLSIYSYGVMLALAILICGFFLGREAKKQGISPEVMNDLIFFSIMGGISGARIFYVFLNFDFFAQNPLEIFMIWHGGLAWQGGLIGGLMGGIIFARSKRLSVLLLLDLCAPYLALGQSIGRIGCFLNGCCYGKPLAWGIYFPVHQDRLHPTQLYETAGLFLVFLILKFYQQKPHATGKVFALYLSLIAMERFMVEFFRADHTVLWLGLSLFQYISIGVFTAGIILYRRFGAR